LTGAVRYSGVGLALGSMEGAASLDLTAARSARVGRVLVTLEFPTAEQARGWAAIVTGSRALPARADPFRACPLVGGLEPDLFREGEHLTVDGHRGTVEVVGLAETAVVTAFLQRPDRQILLLRRSGQVGSFQGRWASVSGFLDRSDPEARARQEILEEVGFGPDDISLVRGGRVVYARDGERVFAVHPFRFETRRIDPRLDWEHDAFEWAHVSELRRRSTVPNLDRAWAAVDG
jgi:8-oxo-dGTP pyrophosphatase MutT (NUDIX family)